MKNENGEFTDIEKVIRLQVTLEQLVTKVDKMASTIDHLKDNYVVSATADQAVTTNKVERLESIVYSALGAIGVQLLALMFLLFGK